MSNEIQVFRDRKISWRVRNVLGGILKIFSGGEKMIYNLITQEKHPYIYWQDFDKSSRITKSNRHILDIVKNDILSNRN